LVAVVDRACPGFASVAISVMPPRVFRHTGNTVGVAKNRFTSARLAVPGRWFWQTDPCAQIDGTAPSPANQTPRSSQSRRQRCWPPSLPRQQNSVKCLRESNSVCSLPNISAPLSVAVFSDLRGLRFGFLPAKKAMHRRDREELRQRSPRTRPFPPARTVEKLTHD
jgi:hypothetical protein